MSSKKRGGGGGGGGGGSNQAFDLSQLAGLLGPSSVIIINPSISMLQSAAPVVATKGAAPAVAKGAAPVVAKAPATTKGAAPAAAKGATKGAAKAAAKADKTSSKGSYPNNYKTVLCAFFKKDGGCSKGMECHYAHGEEELRSLPDEKVQKDSGASSSSHGERELAPRSDYKLQKGSDKSSSSHGERELKQSKLSRWMKKSKTELCTMFPLGKCTFGDKCNFAHSVEELIPNQSEKGNPISDSSEKIPIYKCR